MSARMYSIPGPWPGRLGIVPRPRGGDWLEDEVRVWRDLGIDVVVSLLASEEEDDLGLREEGRLAARQGIRFVPFPIADRGVPSSVSDTAALLANLRDALDAGRTVAVHCRQGIGRSALVAAGVLMVAGASPVSALETIQAARGVPVPETPQQQAWIETLSDFLVTAHRY
jgi:protein-tyrosine phosphatase